MVFDVPGVGIRKHGKPYNVVGVVFNGYFYVMGGESLHSHDSILNTVEAFFKALKIRPDYNLARFNLGIAYYQLKEYDSAIKKYGQVVEKIPGSLSARQNLAITYYDTGKFEKAIYHFEYLLKKYPDDVLIKGFLKSSREMAVKNGKTGATD